MMNAASVAADSIEVKTAPEIMIQMITQSVAASPWPATPHDNSNITDNNTGGIFITSAAAVVTPDPAITKRSHSRNRGTWSQFNIVEEDPRTVLERLEPIPVIRNEANEKTIALQVDPRKKSSPTFWFSFFNLSRRSSANDPASFKPKGILKQVDDGSSVSSNEITTSASPLQKPKKVGRRLRFDNEVRVCETFHKEDYCRESVEYVAKHLSPAVAVAIKRELNEIKQEMHVHDEARHLTQFYIIK